MSRVLFVCLHNAGRSQMSEALFSQAAERLAGKPPSFGETGGCHEARSAGTAPGERVHPEVVEAMSEIGIDIADRIPRKLTQADAEWADVVVTMGCGDECPHIPGKRYLDWDLRDPRSLPIEDVRAIRDEIAQRVDGMLAELDT